MGKLKKILLGVGGACILTAALIVGNYTYRTYQADKSAKEAAAELKRKQDIVDSYSEIAYNNKYFGEIDLSGLTEEEIISELEKESDVYSSRKVRFSVDGDEYIYSMKKLKENIYYKTSDGKKYKIGQEDEIAQQVVGMDKDKELLEQYDIIKNGKDATGYKISLKCKYNKKKLGKLGDDLNEKYIVEVQNSHIQKNGEISEAHSGRDLDIKNIKKKIKKYLNSLDKEDFVGKFETTEVKPEWHKKDLKKVNTVISEFSTTFVSTTDRGHNVKLGAERINGTCLLPGESVSFDEVIHDNSDGDRFRAAGSYLHGKVVQTEGGGICQVSTTAYGALLRAGIIPEVRYPHSMPVHYVPLGLDAAISQGVKDLKVKNTFDVPIVIKAFSKGNTLTFQIISYPDALKGYTYEPRAVRLSSLSAKAYLDIYKDGKKIEEKLLHTDRYISGS